MYKSGTMLWVADEVFSKLDRGEHVDVLFRDGRVAGFSGESVDPDFTVLPSYYAMSVKTLQNSMTRIGHDKSIRLRSVNIGDSERCIRVTRVW